VPVQLKWPNDLLLDGGKLGGVLVETGSVQRAGHRQWWAVVGVGINIALPEDSAASLMREVGQARVLQGRRNEFLAGAATALARMLARFDSGGFAPLREQWNRLHAHAGMAVRIIDGGSVQAEGTAMGVDEQGALLLHTAAGVRSVQAGDVSLRAQADTGVS
jgi:BirA family biotin operon repressor/biotin-[acetyl-CoA-carboxylase] ligase